MPCILSAGLLLIFIMPARDVSCGQRINNGLLTVWKWPVFIGILWIWSGYFYFQPCIYFKNSWNNIPKTSLNLKEISLIYFTIIALSGIDPWHQPFAAWDLGDCSYCHGRGDRSRDPGLLFHAFDDQEENHSFGFIINGHCFFNSFILACLGYCVFPTDTQ